MQLRKYAKYSVYDIFMLYANFHILFILSLCRCCFSAAMAEEDDLLEFDWVGSDSEPEEEVAAKALVSTTYISM